MRIRGRKQVSAAAAAVAVMAFLAACSSSSSTTSTPAGGASTPAGGASTPAGGASTPAGGGSASSGAAVSGTLNASGSTFQTNFQQTAIASFKSVQSGMTVNYGSGGSGKGRTDLASGTVNFAGSDSPIPSKEASNFKGKPTVLYFPVQIGPIAMAYNLSGVTNLKLDATVLAGMFQGKIKTWDDPAIKALNSGVSLPSSPITLVVRSDSSGTTANFSQFLVDAAGSAWTLGTSSIITWPSTAHAANGGSGVADAIKTTPDAIGYVDDSTAKAAGLSAASIKNMDGDFIAPSTAAVGRRGRRAGQAQIRPDVQLRLAAGRPVVPDHLPIVGPGVRDATERERRRDAPGLHRLPARGRSAAAHPARSRAAAREHRLAGQGPAQ